MRAFVARLAAAGLSLTLVACQASPTGSTAASPSGGPTAVVVDTDLGLDDLVALAFIVRDPAVRIAAVAVSGTGLVHCGPGLRVARSLLDAMGATDVPIGCGRTSPATGGHPFPDEWRTVADSGYGVDFPLLTASQVGPVTDAPKLIAKAAAAAPVTVLELAPMTNLADALLDPAVAPRIVRIVAMAGAVAVPGNVTPPGASEALAAEWNVYADPAAAKAVLASAVPVTLVPLDATAGVVATPSMLTALSTAHGAAGADIVAEAFALMGVEPGRDLWDALAAVALVEPGVVTVETKHLAVDVSTGSSSGRLVPDAAAPASTVAVKADAGAFERRLLAGLALGAQRAHPFTMAGTVELTFDGTACHQTPPTTLKPGAWKVRVTGIEAAAGVAVVRLHDGSTWPDLVAFNRKDPSIDATPPFIDLLGWSPPSGSPPVATIVARLTAGTYGALCLGETRVYIPAGPLVVSP